MQLPGQKEGKRKNANHDGGKPNQLSVRLWNSNRRTLRAREQGRDPGLERSHRAVKVYELRRFPVHPWGQVQDLPIVEPGQQGDHGTVGDSGELLEYRHLIKR